MTQPRSLYERLGGYDVIAAFMTEYVNRLRADPKFSRFWGGTGNEISPFHSKGVEKKRRDLQLNIDYMCKVTGSSNYYMGRDMKTAHSGLGITDAEWEVSMGYMAEALDKYRIPPGEKQEVLALVDKMKRDIVEK